MIPSLSQLKSFSLPGIKLPKKVIKDQCIIYMAINSHHIRQCYSSSGIPYYINLPSVILQQSLSNPEIAEKLHLYPKQSGNVQM